MNTWTRSGTGTVGLLDELLGFQEDFNRLLDDGTGAGYRVRRPYPLVNIWESTDGLVVDAELPGINPSDVDIAVANGRLTISGKYPEAEGDAKTYQRRERTEGEFTRAFELPYRVEAETVTATYKNGILRVTLPRAEADKPKRITVKAA